MQAVDTIFIIFGTHFKAILSVAVLATSLPLLISYFKQRQKTSSQVNIKKASKNELPAPTITPVDKDFKWEKTNPYPYRPYKKGDYKMTLAIRKLDPNNLIVLEDTYLDRTNLREKLFDETGLYGCHESAIPALKETYKYIFKFLTERYPMYFCKNAAGDQIFNKIRNEYIPVDPNTLDIKEVMRIIAKNIEEDFLILIKNPDSKDFDEYVLRGAVSLFPAGFNPIEKLNRPLTTIHGPVPGYRAKLQTSMNKFFDRLKINEFIVRNNWSFQVHTNLCAPTGSHATTEEAKTIENLDVNELDFNKVFFRCEKQSFTRLPESKADLMFIRTYVTSAMELRDKPDVDIETLCSAIDGLKGDFSIYKRRVQWGEAVKSFLRKESNGSTNENSAYKFVH